MGAGACVAGDVAGRSLAGLAGTGGSGGIGGRSALVASAREAISALSAAMAAAVRRGARVLGSGLPSATGRVSALLASLGMLFSISDTGYPRGAPLSYRREGVRRAEGAGGQNCPDRHVESSTRCVLA